MAVGAGFYGKVPALGDFLCEELSTEFITCWHEWLAASIAVSKEQLADDWLNNYLVSPVWHFALSPGVCGPESLIGTMIPSVDKVGRHFPFILAKSTEQCPVVCWEQSQWCEDFEQVILQTLEDDFNLATWRAMLKNHKFNFPQSNIATGKTTHLTQKSQNWQLKTTSDERTTALLHLMLKNEFSNYSLWWTEGSEEVEAVTLIAKGLPLISQYSAMIDGNWAQRGWLSKFF